MAAGLVNSRPDYVGEEPSPENLPSDFPADVVRKENRPQSTFNLVNFDQSSPANKLTLLKERLLSARECFQ